MERFKEGTSIVSTATIHTAQTAKSIAAVFSVHPTTKTVTSNRISKLINLEPENLFSDI